MLLHLTNCFSVFRIRICMDPHWFDPPEAGSSRKEIEQKKNKYINLILVANLSTMFGTSCKDKCNLTFGETAKRDADPH